jgi:hypothetical protein
VVRALVVTDMGIESRMTRRQNKFRHGWTDVGSFEFVDNGKQVAIAMRLRDGSRTLLPSTRVWSWEKRAVNQIYSALLQEQAVHDLWGGSPFGSRPTALTSSHDLSLSVRRRSYERGTAAFVVADAEQK